MKYTMQLISRDELKRKLERKDQFKLVMALGDWQYRAKHIPGSLHFPTLEDARVLPASWPTSTWCVTATRMCAAMRAAYSTGRRLALPSRERWSLP